MEIETIVQLETNLDHLTGEELGMALTALNDMPEVLDAIYLTGIGKKNRACALLQVLCQPMHAEDVAAAIFRHTHTLGIRRMKIERIVLPRQKSTTQKNGEELRAKSYIVEDREYLRPEADDIQAMAKKLGVGAPALRFDKD